MTGTAITVSPTTTTTYTLTATNAAGSVTQSATVTVGAALGSIDIASSPAGATVYLDGVDTGSITPIVLTSVSAGTHTVKLDLYGYQPKEDANISVVAGQTTYLNWPLTLASILTQDLQPGPTEGKDAYVVAGDPDNNYGNSSNLIVGYYSSSYPKYRVYLYFDVASILPADAVITSATLYVYQYYGSGNLEISLYRVTSDW